MSKKKDEKSAVHTPASGSDGKSDTRPGDTLVPLRLVMANARTVDKQDPACFSTRWRRAWVKKETRRSDQCVKSTIARKTCAPKEEENRPRIEERKTASLGATRRELGAAGGCARVHNNNQYPGTH